MACLMGFLFRFEKIIDKICERYLKSKKKKRGKFGPTVYNDI